LLAVSALGLGVAMLGAAVAPTLRWEVLLIALCGATAITFMATANATLQLGSRADMRGRVMALYMVLFVGSTPIGGPIVGWIAEHASPRWSLVVGGVAGLLGAGVALVPYMQRRLALRDRTVAAA
jgi:MFS family permease